MNDIMADKITAGQRSLLMKKIKAKSNLEDKVAKELFKKGIRYRRNSTKLLGKPDISIQKYKVVIFIDSCFWHHCPIHGIIPKSNLDYWKKKLTRNVERDFEVNSFYEERGWNILRVWEHELDDNFESTIDKIICFINEARKMY